MQPSTAPMLPSFSLLFSDKRLAPMLALGFSSGLPLLLVYTTQSAWLSDAKVPIGILGLMSEMTLAYKFKFLWAPLLERYDPPLLGALLGRRRGWIVVAQIIIILAMIGVAFGDPAHWLAWTIVFSLALGFGGATQDVVIDGWRITVAPAEKQPLMLSFSEVGWRVGNFAAGAGAWYLSDRIGWRGAYLCMAVLMLPGMIAACLAPEPESDKTRTTDTRRILETLVTPIQDLIRRLGPMALPILLLIAGFRMAGYISAVMEVPLFKHLGYSNTDIATVTKVFGFWVAIGSTLLSGYIVPRIGMMASLMIGTVVGSLSHLSLAYLAAYGGRDTNEFWLFAVTVSIDSFAYALASIVLFTYMSTLVSTAYAASQFALLTSLCALPGSLLAMLSGFVIERVGFPHFFIGTSLIGLPVALLCVFVWYLDARARPAAA